jgi:hypothetical protein
VSGKKMSENFIFQNLFACIFLYFLMIFVMTVDDIWDMIMVAEDGYGYI